MEPQYHTAVVFGKETSLSVRNAADFEEVLRSLLATVVPYGIKLNCRGLIEVDGGKNAAPRAGALNEKKIEAWLVAVGEGYFQGFELFDSEWREGVHPRIHASIRKFWDYSAGEYVERTKIKAENRVEFPQKSGQSVKE